MSNNHLLPFDQYSRLSICQQTIDKCIRPVVGARALNIVDLGGHKGHTRDFFPKDNVTILDVFDEKYEGYIKGDATNTSFKDKEFDVAVSFDTLEHIPASKRGAFLSEAARISRHAFILAAPFDNRAKDVSWAESQVNELYRTVKGVDHPWLKEHIEYGIPQKKQTEDTLNKLGVGFRAIPTNNLILWTITQGLMFNAAIMEGDTKEVVDVSLMYNSNLSDLESIEGEAYRQIYIGSYDKKILQAVDALEARTDGKPIPTSALLSYVSAVNSAYATLIKRLFADRAYLMEREAHLQREYDKVESARQKLVTESHDLHHKTRSKVGKALRQIKRPENRHPRD